MAWNPSPKVAAARDIGDKFKKDKVIIVLVDETLGTYEVVSYGKTRNQCRQADLLGEHLHNQVIEFYEKNAT